MFFLITILGWNIGIYLPIMTVSEYIMSLNSLILSIGLFIYYLFIIHDLLMPGNETVVDIDGCYTIKK